MGHRVKGKAGAGGPSGLGKKHHPAASRRNRRRRAKKRAESFERREQQERWAGYGEDIENSDIEAAG